MTTLERIRRRRNLSYMDLSRLSYVSDETIRNMERGNYDRKSHQRVQTDLARALDVPISKLFTKEGRVK